MSKASLTTRIKVLLILAILATIGVVSGSLVWMAETHNRLAIADSRTMVSGAVSALEAQLGAVTKDYSHWQDAFDSVAARNDAWVYSNMGSGVTQSDMVDLLVIVQPGGTVRYGWRSDLGEESDPTILDRATVDMMVSLLDSVPADRMEARAAAVSVGDGYFVLASARISPDEIEGLEADKLAVNILGYELTPARVSEIGAGFLIKDLTLSASRESGKQSLAITRVDGTDLAYLNWTPPKPGDVLLARAALPVGMALVVFAVVGLAAAQRVGRAAGELAESERTASRAARTDSLTGLPNRFSFGERIVSPEVAEAAATGRIGLIYVDLNRFKVVNDTIGHAGGDELIRQLTGRLLDALPDEAVLARVGGDEFNALIVDPKVRTTVAAAAHRVLKAIKHGFTVDGTVFHITASVGHAVSEDGSVGACEILRRADVAMRRAKAIGASEPIGWEPALESGAAKKKVIEEALRRAMHGGELDVHYQPIVDAHDGRMSGAEALLCWTSRDLGQVAAGTFVPVAEATGLIVEIGEFVLRRICEDIADHPDLWISVNVSPVQLRDPSFVETFVGIVDLAGINPRQIEIELTEGTVIADPDLAREKLSQLRDAGFRIALDDFGTGFSSIGYLRQFDFDKLKIDRSFVSDVGQSEEINDLLQSFVMLGKSLKLQIVAEGIESENHVKLIGMLGVDFMQGSLFGKAMSFESLAEIRRGCSDGLPGARLTGSRTRSASY